MRGKISIFLLAGLVVSLCALTTLVQAEEQKAQLYFVREAAVKPSRIMEYAAIVKELVALETKHEFPYPIYAYGTDDFIFYHSIPLENSADLDNLGKAMDELMSKIGAEQGQKIQKLAEGTTEYRKDGLVLLRPDLSYTPENPRLKPEEANFYFWTFFYIRPDKEKEAEEIAKKFVALNKSKNIPDGYDFYVAIMGSEAPLFIIIQKAKNAADFYSQDNNKLLGEEGKALWEKAWSLVRKYETKQGWFRPDISYIPKEK